ncbi:MAG: PAS domain S-box protein [Clostridia bacterium]
MAKARQARKPKVEVAAASLRPSEASPRPADAALRESEERFRAIVNSANEGILVYDRDLKVSAGNLAAERIIGLPLAELIGKPGFTSLLPCVREDGTPLPPEERPTRITIRSGLPLTDQIIGIKRPDGSITWLSVNTAFLRRPGEVEYYGVVSVVGDITAQRNAEEELRRFRAAMDTSADIIVLIDRESMRYVDVNVTACRLLGYSREELLAMGPQDVLPIPRAELERAYDALIADPAAPNANIRSYYRCKDGSHLPYESTRQVLRSGNRHMIVAVSRDIRDRIAAEAALRESEERFRQTFELAGSGIAHVDLQGRFQRVNRMLCEILGYTEEELIGRSVKDISHPADRDVTDTQRSLLRERGSAPVRFEKRYLRKDGATVWVDLAIALVRGHDGQPTHEIAVFDDISETKQAEQALRESEERFRSLTQVSSDWYWEQDDKFCLTFMSTLMEKGTGLPASTYLGKQRWDRPALNLTEEDWRRHREQLVRHEPFRDFEILRAGEDGRKAWVSLSGQPIFDADGKFKGYRGVGKNISERKEAEAELRRAHDELARSNSELEQFAYVASHDLQEPLRMVSSYTQLLQRRYGDKLDGDAKEFMAFIVDGAGRMKQLIEDLLAYSRVGTRGKEPKPAAVEGAVRRAITNVRAALEESGASITYDPLPTVPADEVQLAQLFQNLFGNALKFRSASVPRIHVSAKELEHEWEFAVQDNGIGIEPQYFERIFKVFQRLHDKAQYPGTGIGLAICKKVVERHGGHIWVSSQPGEGSTFHFTLPKAKEPA